MKRISRRPALLAKKKVKAAQRSVDVPYSGRVGDFYNQIAMKNGDARVCVVRSLGGIGDVLMTTPALRELKRRWPNLNLTYAVDMHRTQNNVYYELVKNAPFINQVVDARFVQEKHYDAVVDISAVCIRYERSDLPAINRIDLFARKLGVSRLRNPLPFYQVELNELVCAGKTVSHLKDKPLVAIHTASFEPKRSWPIDNYLKLIRKSEDINFLVFDFNKKYLQWHNIKNVLDCSNTNVRQMAALIAQSDLFIGPDSGPMHLAGALKIPSLVLFGSIPPHARINHYRTHTALQNKNMSCLGCWYKACPYDTKCMRELSHELVYNEMVRRLG